MHCLGRLHVTSVGKESGSTKTKSTRKKSSILMPDAAKHSDTPQSKWKASLSEGVEWFERCQNREVSRLCVLRWFSVGEDG